MRSLHVGLTLLSLAALPGCVLFPERLDELTILSVEPVQVRTGIPGRGFTIVTALRVTFTAGKNLEWFSHRYGVPIGRDVALCRGEEPDPDNRLASSQPVNTITGLNPDFAEPERRGLPHDRRIYTLDVYARTDGQDLTRTFGDRAGYRWRDHDLRQDPIDVCIQLRGGNPALVWFYSNVVRIPAETIRAALARAPQPR